ncbi:chloride channel protein [Microcoleus sp. FACHB-1515]|nr:chloride channel protein [Microcoleus sp. FACHB-1515]
MKLTAFSRQLPNQLRQLLLGSRRLAIFEAIVIGIVSGLAAVLLKNGVGWIGGFRVQASYAFSIAIALPAIGFGGGAIAGVLVERFAPEAAGSGIPQVKAALANVPIALNLRVALVKLASVMLTLGSGFNLGRQGPTVQVGAALAAQLSRWIPTSPEYRRQLIAAGAAAGLAAGFNAPIAGVLFVVEEFLQDFSGLALGTAILASFVGAVVSRVLGGQGLSLNSEVTSFQAGASLQDVPFFLLLGLLAGGLGALLSEGIFWSLAIYRRSRLSLPLKMGLAGLVSGTIAMLLPAAFRDNTSLQDAVITGEAGWQVTLLTFGVKFLLTIVAFGSGAPGGLFAPALILGSALGYLVGLSAGAIEQSVGAAIGLPPGVGSSTTYALAGMGAFFSGVTRVPITAIVIVFEITTDFNLVLPLMIGSVVASLVADRIGHRHEGSIYTRLLAWNGIKLEPAARRDPWQELTAAALMQPRVETLSSTLQVNEVVEAFARSHHRGFPVMQGDRLVGIVTQSDLADRSRYLSGEATTLADLMTPQPVTVSPRDPLSHVLFLLNHFKLSRLPVTEGQKLVGIITRADIIRAESDHLNQSGQKLGPKAEPSYVVYQTRSPATGKGRLLVPLSNPQTAPMLLKLAAAIAHDRNYELECLQVMIVPRSSSPAEASVRTTHSRRLLRQAESIAREWEIPIHTQIRVAHDAAQAMLEAIGDRHINLILMGWKGSTTTPGRVFGSAVDTIVRQASCEVLLVKLGDRIGYDRWLVPIAGGPNSQFALQLLPALTQISKTPIVRLAQVFDPLLTALDLNLLRQATQTIAPQINCPVMPRPLRSISVADAIVDLAKQDGCDIIMLGASREGLLQQAINGNIPEAIARQSNCTVILVRSPI